MSTKPPEANPLHEYRTTRTIRHSKELALSEREFELLVEGARELSRSDHYYDPDPVMTVYVMGRLGLRRGELVHLHEDWIDWRKTEIQIPAHQPCTKGKDGGVCGECYRLAEQRVEHADELTLDEALRWSWTPKTEAGIRDVYFGHDVRCELFLNRYFESDEYERYEPSGSAVSRRVKKAAELGGLDPESVTPHGLRATAASHFADQNLKVYQLKQIMGWQQLQTSEAYISKSSVKTAKALDSI